MPLLARAKRRVGYKLGSSATVSEAEQNQICAYLSIALLVGLLANALVGWWWADPLAALVIAGVAAKEGVDSWRGRELRVLLSGRHRQRVVVQARDSRRCSPTRLFQT